MPPLPLTTPGFVKNDKVCSRKDSWPALID
jgi:hypothetical protein